LGNFTIITIHKQLEFFLGISKKIWHVGQVDLGSIKLCLYNTYLCVFTISYVDFFVCENIFHNLINMERCEIRVVSGTLYIDDDSSKIIHINQWPMDHNCCKNNDSFFMFQFFIIIVNGFCMFMHSYFLHSLGWMQFIHGCTILTNIWMTSKWMNVVMYYWIASIYMICPYYGTYRA
jgi:hypothetical protein